ncbi:MAG: hypothetical protein ACRCU6_00255 [Fusobacteriaceae bacterium]
MLKNIIVTGMMLGSITLYAGDVYIVPTGKVYHSTKNCKTLSRSKNIKAVDTKSVGNRKPCKMC